MPFHNIGDETDLDTGDALVAVMLRSRAYQDRLADEHLQALQAGAFALPDVREMYGQFTSPGRPAAGGAVLAVRLEGSGRDSLRVAAVVDAALRLLRAPRARHT